MDGAIVCLQEKGGNLFTAGEYSDFILRLEIKIPEGANNGLAIRSPAKTGNATPQVSPAVLAASVRRK